MRTAAPLVCFYTRTNGYDVRDAMLVQGHRIDVTTINLDLRGRRSRSSFWLMLAFSVSSTRKTPHKHCTTSDIIRSRG